MSSIVEILKMQPGKSIIVNGWIRSFRGNRFIALNDGSCMASLQIVVEPDQLDEKVLNELNTGASINVEGELVERSVKSILPPSTTEVIFEVKLATGGAAAA